MRRFCLLSALPAMLLALIVSAETALAQAIFEGLPVVGKPAGGPAVGFQPATTSIAEDVRWLGNMVDIIMLLIVVFVFGLVAWCIFRFNRRRNPAPGSFTHNSPIEITWTVVPILILVFIGSFSLPVLFNQQIIPEADVTIKATGFQWYWGYEYPDHDFAFDSFLLGKDELAEYGYSEDEYLLATDTAMVVPVGKTIVVQVTGADVIHSWTIPSFGVKQDGVPGRLAELWFRPDREGVYFGQCSELCGKDHAYMPITVKVVSEAAYAAWLDTAIAEYAGVPRSVTLASAE